MFLSFVLPSNIQVVKYVLLSIIIAIGTFEYVIFGKEGKFLLSHTFDTAIIFTTLGLFFLTEGIFNGFSVLRTVNFYIVYPLLFCWLFFSMSDVIKFKYVDSVIIIAFSFTAGIFLLYLTGVSFEIFKGHDGIQNSDGFVKYSFVFFSFWVFSIPYILTRVFYSQLGSIKKTFLYFLLLLFGLLCGRKAILLNVLALNLIFILISIKSKKNVLIILLNMIFLLLFINFFLGYLLMGFDFYNATNISAYTRTLQFNGLLRTIWEYPIFGVGLAGISEYYQRDDPLNPFAYELYYLSLIMWFGIIGFLLYSINFCRIIYYSFICYISYANSEHKKYFYPIIVGLFSFLIASGTNPYFAKFDSMWYVFMVVLYSDITYRKKINE